MNSLEQAIQNALHSEGQDKEANKAYLEFIKANFLIPIEKKENSEPEVLYLVDRGLSYLPVFSNQTYFDRWAEDIKESIQILHLTGVNLLKGIGENVTVCLNIGSEIYKEFNPQELARMKSMVLKLFK